MAITETQRADRKNQLGGSDIAKLMNLSPYGNKYDLWLEKTGRVQPKERTQGYITAGNLLEQPIIEWLRGHLDCGPIVTRAENMECTIDGTPIVVHMDGIVRATNDPIEVKTEGVDHPMQLPWGEHGSDEVPEHVCIQAHCHLMATEREICHVPTFLGGRGFGYFFVKRDDRIVELIKRQAIDFWENNVLKDIPPENIAPSLAMAKRIRSVEGEPRQMDVEKVQAWLDAKEAATAAVNAKEFHHAGLLADLDGAEMGTYFEEGEDNVKVPRIITNFSQNRKGYTCEPTSFRVLRLKKRK